MTHAVLPSEPPRPTTSPTVSTLRRFIGRRLVPGVLLSIALLGAAAQTRAADAPAKPATIPVVRPARSTPVDFNREVVPVLQANCLPCHNQKTPKGDLNLETPAAMLHGGESGPSIVAGKAAESLLLRVATHEAKPRMPPKDNKVNAANLTPNQLGLVALWIDQGARAGDAIEAPLRWQEFPTNYLPIFATALSPDGQIAAAGRANRIHLYRVPGTRFLHGLRDPALPDKAAQRDWVNALAFSPDGRRLAAGGYREIRIWERREPPSSRVSALEGIESATLAPNRTSLALARPDGTVLLAASARDTSPKSLGSLGSTPRLLRFSPDQKQLAALDARGRLHRFGLNQESPGASKPWSEDIQTLGWCDEGRTLAVARQSSGVIQLLRPGATASEDPNLERELTGHEAPITVLLDGSPLGLALISGSDDGTVRLWPKDPKASARSIAVGAPVRALAVVPGSSTLAVATAVGGTRLWSTQGTPKATAELAGDARGTHAASEADRRHRFLRSEIEYQKGALQRAEEDHKKRTEDQTKAQDKLQASEKAVTEKKQALEREEQNATTATREKTEAQANLESARTHHASADRTAIAAIAEARKATERALVARLTSDQAARNQTELERLLTELTGKSDETVLARAREAALQAAKTAETQRRDSDAAQGSVTSALEALAATARKAGESKAALDRAEAELPARIKKAEEQLAAANKAVGSLKNELDRAKIQRDTAEADVQLARRNLETAAKGIEDTRKALARAEVDAQLAERLAQQAAATRDAATGRGHLWLEITPDGRSLLTLDDEHRLTVWDLAAVQPTTVLTLPPQRNLPIGLDAEGEPWFLAADGLHRQSLEDRWTLARTIGSGGPGSPIVDRVTALAFSPDGRTLASGGGEPSRSGEIKLWNVADGSLLRDLGNLHSDCVLSLAFSPDGEFLASGGADRFLRLSDPRTGKWIRNFEGHTHHVLAVAWKPDGRVLLSGGAEGVVKIWNRVTGDRLKNVENFGKEVTGLTALGSSPEFLAVSGAGQARVFKEDGSQVRTLPAGNAFLNALSATPDGRLAVGGGDDGVLRFWRVGDGTVLGEPGLPTLGLTSNP